MEPALWLKDQTAHVIGPARLSEAAWVPETPMIGQRGEQPAAEGIRSNAAISKWSTAPMTRLANAMGPARLREAAGWNCRSFPPVRSTHSRSRQVVRAPRIRSAAAVSVLVDIPNNKAGHAVGPAGLREAAGGGTAGVSPPGRSTHTRSRRAGLHSGHRIRCRHFRFGRYSQ